MTSDSNNKILIVDDDDMMRMYIKTLLTQNGYDISEAANGKDGLRAFRDITPDLVITDIIMPEMEGITFIKSLREHNNYIPIIAMTGNVHGRMEEYLDISSKLGADEILRKPIKADEFLEAIKRLII